GFGNDATPQRVIDDRLFGYRAAFDGQRAAVERGRVAVERHVADRGNAAGRGGGRASDETLPFGSAGLIEVDVSIDQPRQHVEAAGVEDFVGGLVRVRRQERAHATIVDEPVGPPY